MRNRWHGLTARRTRESDGFLLASVIRRLIGVIRAIVGIVRNCWDIQYTHI